MEKRVFECPNADKAKLTAILEADPYVSPSFTMQGYILKDGSVVDAEAGRTYVYIKCENADFFKFAEEKFKALPSVARCKKEVEEKVISRIEEGEDAAEAGVGAIFG